MTTENAVSAEEIKVDRIKMHISTTDVADRRSSACTNGTASSMC